jgi:hypothetical protein
MYFFIFHSFLLSDQTLTRFLGPHDLKFRYENLDFSFFSVKNAICHCRPPTKDRKIHQLIGENRDLSLFGGLVKSQSASTFD